MRRASVFVGVLLAILSLLATSQGVSALPGVDVSVSKSVTSGAVVDPGNIIQYNIVISNNGDDVATSMQLVDSVPANTTFVSFAGGCCGSTPTLPPVGGTGQITAPLPGPHAKNAFTSWTLRVRVNCGVPAGTVITNTATGSSPSPDPVPANNSSVATTTVSGSQGVNCGGGTPPSTPPTTSGSSDFGMRLDKCVSCQCDITPGKVATQCNRCASTMSCFPDKCGDFFAQKDTGILIPRFFGGDFLAYPALTFLHTDDECKREAQLIADLKAIYDELLKPDFKSETPLILPTPEVGFPGNNLFPSSQGGLPDDLLSQFKFGFPATQVEPMVELHLDVVGGGYPLSDSASVRLGGLFDPTVIPDQKGLLFNPYVITLQNFGGTTADLTLELTPALRAALQSLLTPDPSPGVPVTLDSAVMARVAQPDGTSAPATAAPASVGVTVSSSTAGGKLTFQVTGLPGGQQVSIPIMTAVAITIPGRAPVFAARLTSTTTETNFANNGLLLVEQIVPLAGASGPVAKPVPPQVFQNPGAIAAVLQRPKSTPTPTPSGR